MDIAGGLYIAATYSYPRWWFIKGRRRNRARRSLRINSGGHTKIGAWERGTVDTVEISKRGLRNVRRKGNSWLQEPLIFVTPSADGEPPGGYDIERFRRPHSMESFSPD